MVDEETGAYKRIGLDCHRHYVYADTAMLVLLGRVSAASSLLTIIEEFGMDEQRLNQTFNIMSSYSGPSIYRVAEPYSATSGGERFALCRRNLHAPVPLPNGVQGARFVFEGETDRVTACSPNLVTVRGEHERPPRSTTV